MYIKYTLSFYEEYLHFYCFQFTLHDSNRSTITYQVIVPITSNLRIPTR